MNRVSIGLHIGLSPIRRQAIIQTNAGLLWIGHVTINLTWILFKRQKIYSRKCIVCEMAGILSRGRRIEYTLDICVYVPSYWCDFYSQWRIPCLFRYFKISMMYSYPTEIAVLEYYRRLIPSHWYAVTLYLSQRVSSICILVFCTWVSV